MLWLKITTRLNMSAAGFDLKKVSWFMLILYAYDHITLKPGLLLKYYYTMTYYRSRQVFTLPVDEFSDTASLICVLFTGKKSRKI